MSLIFISHASRPRTQDNFGRGARRAMRFDTRSAATARGVELFLAHPASPPTLCFHRNGLSSLGRLAAPLCLGHFVAALVSTGLSPVSAVLARFVWFFTCI